MSQVLRGIKYTQLYQDNHERMPNFWDRINLITKLQMINLIVITGRSQSGKTTLGRYIAEYYDKNYTLVFTVKEILEYITKIKDIYYSDYDKWLSMRYKWLLIDEPQTQMNKTEFWSERNKVMSMLTTSFGFLKLNLIMCLPNISGISDNVLTNMTFRVDVKAILDKEDKIKRIAFIKKPIYNEMRNKYFWVTCERFNVPEIQIDKDYDDRKANNFFKIQLTEWIQRINNQETNMFRRKDDDLEKYMPNESVLKETTVVDV